MSECAVKEPSACTDVISSYMRMEIRSYTVLIFHQHAEGLCHDAA